VNNIFIDTCVWHYWFCYLHDSSRLNSIQKFEAEAFQKIYEKVISSDILQFVYNQRIASELSSEFTADFRARVIPCAEKIPIPLTRLDGAYKLDGSFKFGGSFGGTLRELLTMQGYDHSRKLENAARNLEDGDYLYDTKPRRKEFDVEHMESALECNAKLFISTDERTILNPLKQVVTGYSIQHPIFRIYSIAKLPSEALSVMINNNFDEL